MIGHDLAGRYEILSRIGGGGMALVYKAHDLLLNRKVAVKVLRQQFVNDEEFVRRFRREAQSAAALSHPNVVSIYDVGQEDETHYIVMEYVEGHNLNEIIQERAPLQADEAIRIAQQICDALDHAHLNHIIHRDIKPHNILIGNNGRVKVTDFGIARAVTSSTITQTGSVIGSVHYFSPEHAKGVNTGEKSDLYSLGIVLYQMLTGQLPFLGESPISVALKHLQETFEEPRVVNPHIPQSVENVILKAMRKNPGERYGSAREMLHDLDTCLRPERLNEPKVSFSSSHDWDETKVMPAIRPEYSAEQPIKPSKSQPEKLQHTGSMNTASVKWSDEETERSSKGGWKKPLLVALITLAVLALAAWGFKALLNSLDTPEVEVPYVVGKHVDEAIKELEEAGLRITMPLTSVNSKDVPKDEVIEQSRKNMRVKEGTFIDLTVSLGPELKEAKNYVSGKLQAAINDLAAMSILEDRIKVTEKNSEDEPGTIIEQTPPAGEAINPETVEFSFVVSLGPETEEIPELTGYRVDAAKALLKSLGFVLEDDDIVPEASYLIAKDHVIGIDDYMPGDQVAKGTKVTIRVSTGPPADAITYRFVVRISPAISGKASEVRITYSDATGENLDGGTHTITSQVDITVPLILAPDSQALVTVIRDNQFMDSQQISYDDIKSGSNSTGLTIPGEEPPPPVEPPAEEPTQGEIHESGGEEEEQQDEHDGHEGH